MDLNAAVLAALEPVGMRERLRRYLSRGLTVKQIYERLAPDLQAQLMADTSSPVLARRLALDRIEATLHELMRTGRIDRNRVRVRVGLRGKGARLIWIDAYHPRDP